MTITERKARTNIKAMLHSDFGLSVVLFVVLFVVLLLVPLFMTVSSVMRFVKLLTHSKTLTLIPQSRVASIMP
jgi:hypothetical protein